MVVEKAWEASGIEVRHAVLKPVLKISEKVEYKGIYLHTLSNMLQVVSYSWE
jgi:hypothetical protein